MGIEIYKKDQAKVLFDVWPEKAETFILGGTADGYEAQTVKEEYSNVKCIGFEPNKELYEIQENQLQFPGDLYPCALGDNYYRGWLKTPHHANGKNNPRSSSIVRDFTDPKFNSSSQLVSVTTLSRAETINGPWNNIVLWLDIECSEYIALKGAERLFRDNKILMVNVEVFYEKDFDPIFEFFNRYGFEEVKRWNTGGMLEVGELIYKRKDLI